MAAPLLPILWLQGRRVRKHTPRLPEAPGPTVGTIPAAGYALRLLVIGESTVAGCGAPDHAQALTGQLPPPCGARGPDGALACRREDRRNRAHGTDATGPRHSSDCR